MQHSFFYLFILVWWSRRNDNSQRDCGIDLDNENPSLEGKICGKLFLLIIHSSCKLNVYISNLIRLLLC